ncbi:MAG: hypothetical protein AAGF99_03880 [Bacteroidota bacterium]
MTLSLTPRTSLASFALATAAILAVALTVGPRVAAFDQPEALAWGVLLDLVVLVPGLFYVLVARPRGWSWVSVLPVALGGAWLAGTLLPDTYAAPVRWIYLAVPLLEIGVLTVVLVRVGRVVRAIRASEADDVLARLRAGLTAAIPGPAAEALAYELAVLRYALGPTAPLLKASSEVGRFTSHRTSSYRFILVAGLIGGAVELVGVHLLLTHVAPGWAWLHLVVSAYALVWLLGDYRAMHQRPTTLHEDETETLLRVRLGLRWRVDVPLAEIDELRRITHAEALKGVEGYLNLGGFDAPQRLLVLRAPIEAIGPYGLRKSVTLLGVRVDEPVAFTEALRSRLAALR